MNSFILLIILAAAECFSFSFTNFNDTSMLFNTMVNTTYDGLDGEYFVDRFRDIIPILTTIIFDVKLMFFLFVLFSFIFFFSTIYRSLRMIWRICWYTIFPCVRCVRYVVPIGAERRPNIGSMRYHAFGDDVTMPGDGMVSASITPCGTSALPSSAMNDNGESSITSPPPKEETGVVMADPLLEQLECSPVSNVMFSGKMSSTVMRKKRRRPPSDLIYKEMTNDCYGKIAWVASFDWQSALNPGDVAGYLSVEQLARLTPRYAWLTRMWTYYRFGIRVITVPQVNPMGSGSLVVVYTPQRSGQDTGAGSAISRRTWEHFGFYPHCFMTPSANQHAELVLDDVTLGRWLNNQDMPTFPNTSIPQQFPIFGDVYWFVHNRLNSNTGGPSSLRFNVYVQLINIHTKLPQVIRANAQGLIEFNTTTIGQIRDSIVSPNVSGDKYDVNGTIYGMDYPSDRRQYQPVMRRAFQKCHHWNNVIDVHRISGSGRDAALRPFQGIDENSFVYLANCEVVDRLFDFSVTDVAYSRTQFWRVHPQNILSDSLTSVRTVHDYIFACGRYVEYEYIVFDFYVPKVAYQNGKYLVTVTSGITPPNVLETPNLSMTAAASMIIDLSGKELIHTLRIPFALVSEMMPCGQYAESALHGVWSICVYCLTPMTATVMSPSTVNVVVSRRFEGLRLLYPTGHAPSKILAFGDLKASTSSSSCDTTAAQVNLVPDKTLTLHADDLISFKQLWKTPHYLDSCRCQFGTAPQNSFHLIYTYRDIIQSLPGTEFFRFFNGSLRLFLNLRPNRPQGGVTSETLGYEILVQPLTRQSSVGLPGADLTLKQWAIENAKYAIEDNTTTFTPYRNANGYNRLLSKLVGAGGDFAVPDTSKSFCIKLGRDDREAIIEVPIITPFGFTTYSSPQYPFDNNITLESALSGGVLIVIAPDLTLYTQADSQVNVQVDVAGGDDFEGHCFNLADCSGTDRIATISCPLATNGNISVPAGFSLMSNGGLVISPYSSTF